MKQKLLIILPVISIIIFFGYSAVNGPKMTHGFASYYTFSRILLEEKDIAKAYDTAYFNNKIKEYGIENIHDIVNIPTSAFLFVPVAWMEPPTAKITWTVLSVLFLFISVILLLKTFSLRYDTIPEVLIISIPFLFYPVYYNIALGQVYILILFLFTLSIYGLKRNNAWLVSIPLAVIILIKGYGIIPLIFLLFYKKWKEFIITVCIIIAVMLITLPLISFDTWNGYIYNVVGGIGFANTASFVSYQTINSLLRHLFIYDAIHNPYSVLNLNPGLINALLLSMAILFISFFISKKKIEIQSYIFLYVISISLNVIFAPLAEEYHYILFLPLIFMLSKLFYENYKSAIGGLKTESIFFALCLIGLAVPLGYKSLQNSQFPVYLLAYPKLCCGIIMILVSSIVLKKHQTDFSRKI